jgi:AcrR family transcriptional regulator
MDDVPRDHPPRRGRPSVTSRAQILAAARRIIDEDGWGKLTLRRLAGDLGIGTTTLYHHVRDREDLLILLVNEHTAEGLGAVELPSDPRERIVEAMVAIHDSLAAWPWTAEVLTVDGFLARLGDPALRMVEAVLAGAVELGCTQEQAVTVFRTAWYYTAGELLVRARSRDRGEDLAHRQARFRETFDDPRMPQLAAVGDRWPELASRDTFRPGLTALVDGLLAQAAAR